MNQRGVAIVAEYLSMRPQGRVVRVEPIGDDDYLMAIEDVRDGRVQLIRSAGDLEVWLTSFRQGRLRAAGRSALWDLRSHPRRP